MAVNESFWGNKNTWVSYNNGITFSPAPAKENYTFAYGRNGTDPPTRLPEGENFDLSAAPWGIGGDSILCKLNYLLPLADNTVDVRPVDPAQYGKPHPLILTGNRQCVVPNVLLNSTLGLQDGRIKLVDWYKPDFKPDYSVYSDYSFWTQNVIINFDYSKILLVPYIITTTGDSYNASNVANDTYYTYWTFEQVLTRWNEIENQRAIKGLYLAIYNGNAGSRSAYTSFLFNIPQHYPKVEIINTQWGVNPKPLVNTDTLIANGWVNTSNWSDSFDKAKLISSSYSNIRYYSDLDTWEKSLQWWSHNGNPVSYMDDEWLIYQQNPADTGDKVIRPIYNYTGKTAQQVVDYFIKQVALLGFPFALDPADKQGIIGEDNSICLPVFENGITTGEYKKGTACRTLDNFLWRDDVHERNDYDPYNQGEEIDKGYLNNKPTSYPRYSYHESVYDLTASEFKDFVSDVNGLYLDDPQHGYEQCQLDFKGSNPTDYIIAVHGIPFAPTLLIPTAPSDYIQIGPVVLPNAKGKIVDTSLSLLKNCGTIYVDTTYGDFRDYAPYSQYLLYVPMFGVVELDGAEIVGHDLELIIYYDITTMAATACIYRDSITLIKTINGTIGATLPLTAARMGDYQNAIHSLQMGIAQSEIRIATSAATTIGALALAPETGGLSVAGAVSSVSSMVNSGINISNLKYEISHKQPNIATLSSASGAVSQWLSTFRPVLYCRHAKMLPQFKASEYAHTIGYACCVNAKLGVMRGYTVATNIDCSGISLTAEEINSIKEAFKVGVYM